MPGDADLPLEHARIEPRSERDGPPPAVVVLHGRGADEGDLLPVAERLPDALDVISLRAPRPLGPGYTWYDLDLSGGGLHASQPAPEDFRESLDLIAASVEAAVDAYDLDPGRIGLLGFSQGAITSLSLLLESPERYAWVVALHGYLPDSHADRAPEEIAGKPVFVGAGAGDEVIPAERGEAAAERLRAVGCDVRFEVYDAPHGIGEAELGDVVAWVDERVEG